MAYIDEYGNIHRFGENLSHVAERMPTRYSSFSAGYAFGGLFAGAAAGFVVSVIVKLIAAVISFEAAASGSSVLIDLEYLFSLDVLFTSGTLVTVIVFALIGFFWDGLEATGDVFLVSMASIGLVLGTLIGFGIGLLLAALFSAIWSISDMTAIIIILVTTSLGAVISFFWNGIESSRESFSILRAFIGILCGLLKGALKCLSLLLSYGCGIIILAIILGPLTAAIAVLIIVFHVFKGFFVIGSGGDWDDL